MIEQNDIEKIIQKATDGGVTDVFLESLRKEHPGWIIRSEDDDLLVEGKPAGSGPGFHLYLIDTSDHCLTLTSDFASAGGILFGIVSDEDGD